MLRWFVCLALTSLLGQIVEAEELEGISAITELSLVGLQATEITAEDGPTAFVYFGVPFSLLTTLSAIKYNWPVEQTRRRLRDAAQEADIRILAHETTPIENSAPQSSLRLVADIERQALAKIDPEQKPTSLRLAQLIVEHARQIEQMP